MDEPIDPREALLEAAGTVFAEKGYDGATVREICQKAGLNVAAVNYYFRDKNALYIEAVKLAHCTQGELPRFDVPSGTPAEERLEGFLRQMLGMMLDDGRPSWHLELMMREMSRPTDACVELVRSFIGPMFDALHGILNDLLPADLPEFDRNLIAFSIVAQCLLYRYHRPVGRILVGDEMYAALFDVERLTRHITDFSLAGIRAAWNRPRIKNVPAPSTTKEAKP